MPSGIYKKKEGVIYGNTGKVASLDLRKKLSQSHLGQSPWNKGLVGVQKSTRKGKKFGPLSEQTKTKIGLSHGKGPNNRMWKGGKPNCVYCGKTLSTYKTKTEKCIKCIDRSGEKSPTWKGGVTKIEKLCRRMKEYKVWRSNVFTRDKWTCKTCGSKGYLQAHHIKGFSQIIFDNSISNTKEARLCAELWEENNGVSLCLPCHKLTENFNKKINRNYK